MLTECCEKFVVPKKPYPKTGWWIGQVLTNNGPLVINIVWVQHSGYNDTVTMCVSPDSVVEFDTVQEAKRYLRKGAEKMPNNWEVRAPLPVKPTGNFVCTKCGKRCDSSTAHWHVSWGINAPDLVIRDGHYLCCADPACDYPVRKVND